MKITVKEISELRKETGFSIKGCKEALEESNGNHEEAIKILRLKGLKKLDNREGKTNEGKVFLIKDNSKNVANMMSLECETEATSNNLEFELIGLEMTDCPNIGFERMVENDLKDFAIKVAERIKVGQHYTMKRDFISSYIHHNKKLGVLVGFDNIKGLDKEKLYNIGKDLCFVIAANNPKSLDEPSLDPTFLEYELDLIRTQLKEDPKFSNKPGVVIEKILTGKKQKIFKENCLIEQEFLSGEYTGKKIKDVLPINVAEFKRIEIGA